MSGGVSYSLDFEVFRGMIFSVEDVMTTIEFNLPKGRLPHGVSLRPRQALT